ncbi:MAG: hypothetical protein U0441_38845 [Polyangiaceae bacterium]
MIAVVVAAALATSSAGRAATIPLTSCGATIPAGQEGVLQNDVVCTFRCSGDPSIECTYSDEEDACEGHGRCEPDAFLLEDDATLNLNGHTIEMAYQAPGAYCLGAPSDPGRGRCTVTGPGTFAGSKGDAIGSLGADLFVRDVTIGRCDYAIATRGRLTAKGLVTLNDRENTVAALRGVRLRDSVIAGDYGVVTDGDASVVGVRVTAPGGIIAGGNVRGRKLYLSRFADVRARHVALREVNAVPEEPFQSPSIVAERSLRLADSSVVNIASGRRPLLLRSTCARSTIIGTAVSWGVCADD